MPVRVLLLWKVTTSARPATERTVYVLTWSAAGMYVAFAAGNALFVYALRQ